MVRDDICSIERKGQRERERERVWQSERDIHLQSSIRSKCNWWITTNSTSCESFRWSVCDVIASEFHSIHRICSSVIVLIAVLWICLWLLNATNIQHAEWSTVFAWDILPLLLMLLLLLFGMCLRLERGTTVAVIGIFNQKTVDRC